MNFFNSSDTFYGLFETHTLTMSFNCQTNEEKLVLEKVSSEDRTTYAHKWPLLDERELTVLTAYVHEHDHFNTFVSTPFGILIWRAYQILIRDTYTVVHSLDRLGISRKSLSGPILDWWEKEGRKMYAPFKDQDGNYLEEFVIAEISLLDKFLDILTSPTAHKTYADFTVKQFVELINDLYPRIATRSALTWRPTWKTNLPETALLFGEHTCGFNALYLMEAMSKVREHIVLLKNKADDVNTIIRNWKKTLHSYYKEGYEYAISKHLPKGVTQESQTHLGHAHHNLVLSFCGNIDPVCTSYFCDYLLIENEFPWFRAQTLSDQRNLILIKSEAISTFDRILCKNEVFGDFSQWDSQQIQLTKADSGHLLDVPEVFKIFMSLRARHFRQVEKHFFYAHRHLHESMLSGRSAGNEINKLELIREYNDRFEFINIPSGDAQPELFSLMVPLHLGYQQQFMLNFLYGLPSRKPEEIGKKLVASLRHRYGEVAEMEPGTENPFQEFFSIKMMQSWIPVNIEQYCSG